MVKDSNKYKSNNIIILFSIGIMFRFLVMVMGHNFDFESYQIVGEIVSRGGSVYAETSRYNYGFLFFLIQGFGFSIASHFSECSTEMYRVYIVSVLTLADLGIALYLLYKKGTKESLLFFLNPIAIIITGYHNQFDNIAVLLALMAAEMIDTNDEPSRRDVLSISLFTLGMLTKHITAFFFIWMLINNSFSNIKKRIAYSCVPPAVFLLSFIPFAVQSKEACQGIIDNVFLYRSYNNVPLLAALLGALNVPESYFFLIFVVLLLLLGYVSRNMSVQNGLLLYLASLVAFSSAVANQYLVIPLAALVLFDNKVFYWLYTTLGFVYCLLNANELHLADRLINRMPYAASQITTIAAEGGATVTLMTYILAAFVVVFIIKQKRVI